MGCPRKKRLSELKPGQRGRVTRIRKGCPCRLRLIEMGFVKGACVTVVKYAPLRDPIECALRGCHVALRVEQAHDIEMEEEDAQTVSV